MESHILPFGLPAWRRRREIIKEIVNARSGPPYEFRDVLYLVPNERALNTIKVLFLDALEEAAGARACIPPNFYVLNRFIGSRLRASSVSPFIDELTRGLVLEEISRKVAGRMREITLEPEAIGPSLSPLAGEALDRLYTYGVDEKAVASASGDYAAGVTALLLSIKKEYEAWLNANGLADPSAVKAVYRPGESGFADYKTVILDGFYDADPCELKVMKALAGAPRCVFILEAPGVSRQQAVLEGMPYFGAEGLFTALGIDLADVKEDERAAGEEAVFSGALFEGRTLRELFASVEGITPLSRTITVTSAPNPAEEVYFIARSIKKSYLKGGLELGKVMVFFPALDAYLPLLEEAFNDLGIPYHVSQGHPLVQSPVVTALMNLLSVPLEGYSFKSMRKVFASPFIRLDEPGNHVAGVAAAFGRFARREGIAGGRTRWTAGLADPEEAGEEAGLVRRPLARLLVLAEMIDKGHARLSEWAAATLSLLELSGLVMSVKEHEDARPELASALEGLTDTLQELGSASSKLKGRLELPEYISILRRSLSGKRNRPGAGRVSGVRVLGGLEVLSEPFDAVYAGGLVENSLPRPRKHDVFFTEDVSRRLGLPDFAHERTKDARLFLKLTLGAPRVFLSYPESVNGSPASPSPFLRALEPFYRHEAGIKKGRFCRPLEINEALSPGELMRALALQASVGEDEGRRAFGEMLGRFPEATPGLTRARAVLAHVRTPGPPAPPKERRFTVTELDEYMLCHYRYYHSRVVKSAPEEEPEDDVAPHRAGSIVHEILRDFYTGSRGPVTAGNMDKALKRLRALADEKFGSLPDTVNNRELRRRFVEFLAPRFIEAEAALSETGFSVCGTEMPVGIELNDPETGHIVITGKVDRLEMDGQGDFIVADYKTGSYPGSGKPLKEQFQLPLYAHAVREKGRPSGLVYYNLREGRMRDVVAYDAEVPGASTRNTPRPRRRSQEEMEALIKSSVDAALDAVRGILRGDFRPTCNKDIVCQRCVYAVVCPVGERIKRGED